MAGKESNNRWLRKLLLTVATLLGVIIVVLYYLIATIDIEKHRIRITSFVSQGLGREVRVDGKIELEPSLRPKIVVENITIGNPAWASVPDLVTINRLEFQVELLPLLKRELKILQLDLVGADVHLERDDDGIPNWLMTWRDGGPSQDYILPAVMPVYIEDSTLTLHVKERPPVTISLYRLKATLGIEEPFSIEGTLNLEALPIQISLGGGKLKQLLSAHTPWPVRGGVRIDRVPLTLEGSITDPARLKDIQLAFSTGSDSSISLDDISGDPIKIGDITTKLHVSAREDGHHVTIKSKISRLGLTEWMSHKKWKPVSSVKLDSLESTFESDGRSLNDIILSGRLRLQAKQGEIHWRSEGVADSDVLKAKSISLQADPGKPVKTQIVSWLGSKKTIISVTHQRIVNLLWSETSWPFQVRLQAAGVDAAIKASVRTPGKKRQVTGTAHVTAGGVERIGMLFQQEWPEMGPASVTGNFTINRHQMQIDDIDGIFARASFRGRMTVNTGETSRVSLDLSMEAFDAGNLIPGNKPEKGISIEANSLKLSVDGSGVSIPKSFLNSSWNLTVPTGHMSLYDQTDTHYKFSISDFSATSEQNQSIDFKINARLNDMDLQLLGNLGSLLALNRDDSSLPAELNLRGDGIAADFKGALFVRDKKIRIGGSVEMQSNQMSAWAKLLGADWTYAQPLTASAELDYQPDKVLLQNVEIDTTGVKAKGKVSFASDVSPKFQVHLKEGVIDLAEFIDLNDEEENNLSAVAESPKSDRDRVIPNLSLESRLIESLDARIQIDALKVMARDELITRLKGKVDCTDGVLSVSSFEGQSLSGSKTRAGSKSRVEMAWDTTVKPPKATLSWETKGIDYGLIVKDLGIRNDIIGKLDLRLNVEGHGLTLRDILGSANGDMEIVLGKGRTPRRVIELWGGGLLKLLIPTTWFEEDITDLNCAVGRLDIQNGIVKSNVLLTDTPRITIAGEVVVDLKTEEISGLFEPKNKQATLLRLGTPIRLGGTLGNIKAEPGRSHIVSLGKMVLGLTHPSTIILLFGDLGTTEKNPCKALLNQSLPASPEPISP